MAKAQALEIQAENTVGGVEMMRDKANKIVKQTIKKIGDIIENNNEELVKYRKKDRLYELQKRLLQDSNKKAAAYYQKINILT